MTATSPAGRAGLAVVVGLLGLGAAPPSDLRTDLETVGLALDRAVFQVSRPSRSVAARSGARGYRLEGFGAMFVLAPRALPLPAPTPTAEEREIARFFSEAARELERRLPHVESDEMRLHLQLSLKAMRQTEDELRLRERMGSRAAGIAPGGPVAPARRTLEETLKDLERDVQMMQLLQLETVRDDSLGIPPEVRREIEKQMRLVNEQAEAFAAEAERARQEAERGIWIQLGQQPPAPPAVPALPGAPAPAASQPGPATPPAAPAVPEGAPLAMSPPWQLWIDPMDDPTPDPQGVIQGVGEAVTSVLEQHGARLRALAPHEVIAVAIDFVPATRPGVRARPARTLMVRAKKADIDQRISGQITPAEFRKRVELVEY